MEDIVSMSQEGRGRVKADLLSLLLKRQNYFVREGGGKRVNTSLADFISLLDLQAEPHRLKIKR